MQYQRSRWARFALPTLRSCAHLSGSKADLSQRSLQIEAHIRRLFRLDRAIHAQNFPSEHVVRAAIDRLDADKPAGFVAKCRKRSLPAIAAHHDAVVAGG